MRLWGAGKASGLSEPVMGRLASTPLPLSGRLGTIAYITRDSAREFGEDLNGYCAALLSFVPSSPPAIPCIVAPPNLEYLGNEDVVHLFPDGTVQVLYRRSSEHNTILATEQCNSYCLMCSQPPRAVDDVERRVREVLRLIELISPEAREIGISGGEPTLLGDGLIEIVAKARQVLPNTAVHILSNGRRFKNRSFAKDFALTRHPDLVIGVPLYSDIGWRHDYVVQSLGAYDETLRGLYHLAEEAVRIELRVVLHRQTTERLPHLAQFIARNLPFVEHVALMGLEMTGFTPRNLDELWIDPVEYQPQLTAATATLALAGMRVSIYNHQLCTIPQALWPFAVRSISDWKNIYLPACDGCDVRERCGGFFHSATKKHSSAIAPISLIPQ